MKKHSLWLDIFNALGNVMLNYREGEVQNATHCATKAGGKNEPTPAK